MLGLLLRLADTLATLLGLRTLWDKIVRLGSVQSIVEVSRGPGEISDPLMKAPTRAKHLISYETMLNRHLKTVSRHDIRTFVQKDHE